MTNIIKINGMALSDYEYLMTPDMYKKEKGKIYTKNKQCKLIPNEKIELKDFLITYIPGRVLTIFRRIGYLLKNFCSTEGEYYKNKKLLFKLISGINKLDTKFNDVETYKTVSIIFKNLIVKTAYDQNQECITFARTKLKELKPPVQAIEPLVQVKESDTNYQEQITNLQSTNETTASKENVKLSRKKKLIDPKKLLKYAQKLVDSQNQYPIDFQSPDDKWKNIVDYYILCANCIKDIVSVYRKKSKTKIEYNNLQQLLEKKLILQVQIQCFQIAIEENKIYKSENPGSKRPEKKLFTDENTHSEKLPDIIKWQIKILDLISIVYFAKKFEDYCTSNSKSLSSDELLKNGYNNLKQQLEKKNPILFKLLQSNEFSFYSLQNLKPSVKV